MQSLRAYAYTRRFNAPLSHGRIVMYKIIVRLEDAQSTQSVTVNAAYVLVVLVCEYAVYFTCHRVM